MSKDPAFLIYPNDYLGGTMGFSILQHGAYFMSLLFQFNTGHFSDAAITSIIGADNWQSVQQKFKKDASGLRYNQRLEEEIQKRQNFSASRRENIGKRWGKNDKPLSGKKIDNIHMNYTCNTSVIHMGNGNGNRNEDGKGSKNEDEILFDEFRKLYPGSKRGLKTEFENFIKKTEYFKEVLPNLLQALKNQIAWKKEMSTAGMFVPEWKILQTWINKKCWEEEKPTIENKQQKQYGRQEVSMAELKEQMERVKLS
jgi:uncharacterized protein YdaU (DUF1376 family)